jgi:hypothetical protein
MSNFTGETGYSGINVAGGPAITAEAVLPNPQNSDKAKPDLAPTPEPEQAPQTATAEHKKAEVTDVKIYEHNETFHVQEETEQTLAKVTQDMFKNFRQTEQYLQERYGPNHTATPSAEDANLQTEWQNSWHKRFIEQMRTQYPELQKADITDELINKTALAFVQTTPGLQQAVKMAEWQLATYQRSILFNIKEREAQIKHVQRYLSHKEPSPIKTSEQRGLKDNPLLFTDEQVREALKKGGSSLTRRMQQAWHGTAPRPGESRLDEQRSVPDMVDFKYNEDYTTNDHFRKVGLDKLQQMFLVNRHELPTLGTDANSPTTPDQRTHWEVKKGEIELMVGTISDARIDFYTATGMHPGEIHFNTIMADPAHAGEAEYRSEIQQAHLTAEHEGQGTTLIERTSSEIGQFQDQTEQSIAKVFKQDRKTQLTTATKEIIDTLSQEKQLSEADQARIAELKTQLTETDTALGLFSERDEKIKAHADANDELTALRTAMEVPAIKDEVKTATRLAGATYETEDIMVALGQKRMEINLNITSLQSRKTRLDAKYQAILKLANTIPSTLTSDQKDVHYTHYRGQLDALLNDIHGSSTSPGVDGEIRQLTQALNEINNLETKYRSQIQAVADRQIEVDRLQREKQQKDAEISVAKSRTTFTDEVAFKADLEAKKTNAAEEKKQLESSIVGQPEKLEAYQTYKETFIDGNVDEIHVRTEDAQRPDKTLEYAANLYDNYPKGYILTMQIFFGEDIMRSGKDNIEHFRKASRMFSPDDFLEAYNKATGRRRTNVQRILARDITPTIIDTMKKHLDIKALDGTLGDIPESQRDSISRIRSNNTTPLITIDQNDVTIFEQEIPYYRNTDDLTRRIVEEFYGSELSWLSPIDIAEFKHYAQAVDRRRRERLARG